MYETNYYHLWSYRITFLTCCLVQMDLIQMLRSRFVLGHVKVIVITISLLFAWITSKVANSGTVWS